MDKKSHRTNDTNSGKPKQASRKDRLKSALKANMGRRKAQARARAAETAESVDSIGSDKSGSGAADGEKR